jgi:hypothetical protein
MTDDAERSDAARGSDSHVGFDALARRVIGLLNRQDGADEKLRETMIATYIEEAIRDAFWRAFHKSGEQWFDYLGDDDECEAATLSKFDELRASLVETMDQVGKDGYRK